jgi:hypothetical protein
VRWAFRGSDAIVLAGRFVRQSRFESELTSKFARDSCACKPAAAPRTPRKVPRSLFQGGARRSPPQVVPPCYAGAEGAARLGALPCWPSVPRWAWSRRCPSCAAVTRIKGMAQRLLMIAALASVFPSGILNPPRGYRPASMVGSSPRANRSRKQRAPATTLICASVAASERPLSGSTARSSCPDRSRPRRRPRHGRARSGCGPAGLPVRSCQARATPSTRTTRSTRSVRPAFRCSRRGSSARSITRRSTTRPSPFEAAVDAGATVSRTGGVGRSYCRSSDATAWFVSGTAQTTGPVVRTDRPAVSPGPAVVGVAEEHGRRARAVRDRSQKEIYVFRSQELLICSLENRHCRAPVERSDRSGSSCAPSDRATAAVVSGFATPTERAPEWIGSKPLRP